MAQDGSAWFLPVEHAGVAERLDAPRAEPLPGAAGKFRAAFGFAAQSDMRRAISRAWQPASSLPTLRYPSTKRKRAIWAIPRPSAW